MLSLGASFLFSEAGQARLEPQRAKPRSSLYKVKLGKQLCFFAITEIYKFWVFWSKNGRFVTHNSFSKKGPKTLFLYCFMCSGFMGQGVKKGNFEKPSKKGKISLITEKLFFGIFAVFFWGFFFFHFFFVSCLFFVCFFCFCVFFLEGLRVR